MVIEFNIKIPFVNPLSIYGSLYVFYGPGFYQLPHNSIFCVNVCEI